jgi:3-hydroxyacyl-CoA dehydrogenase/enoyl-CoA hydratase/3-hydroxybutyryl-CoA epimerase
MMVHEAALCVAEGVVASWKDADLGANLGLRFPESQGGLLGYRDRIGEPTMARQFALWERRYGPRFRRGS